jgi:AhpD family alkylhydroperoxidase
MLVLVANAGLRDLTGEELRAATAQGLSAAVLVVATGIAGHGYRRADYDANRTEGFMNVRLNYGRVAQGVYRAMDALDTYLATCGLEESLVHLVSLRASQINGCAYCLDMHWKDLRAIGESEQRLYSLDAWQECPYYSERERAALAWTEAVTLIADGRASDSDYAVARSQFTEKELADLTLVVATINAWNRLSIAGRLSPSTYQPAKAGV